MDIVSIFCRGFNILTPENLILLENYWGIEKKEMKKKNNLYPNFSARARASTIETVRVSCRSLLFPTRRTGSICFIQSTQPTLISKIKYVCISPIVHSIQNHQDITFPSSRVTMLSSTRYIWSQCSWHLRKLSCSVIENTLSKYQYYYRSSSLFWCCLVIV